MSFPVFEAMMLICFGAAWPFSIWRSYRSGTNSGKSLLFLCIVDFGYLCGILHKLFWSRDAVLWLYVVNFVMVSVDIFLFAKNARLSH